MPFFRENIETEARPSAPSIKLAGWAGRHHLFGAASIPCEPSLILNHGPIIQACLAHFTEESTRDDGQNASNDNWPDQCEGG